MSDPNIFVSNGTCYTASGEKLDKSFIPCGNDAFGHQTCCGAGDNCIADRACFGIHGSGYGSYLTYWAGCSDPEYKDASCPKKDVDQPWVALTLCDNSNGEWAICSQEGNPSTLQPGSFCSCTVASSATVAFSDSTSLTNICSLPQSTGQSIKFFAGHTPTSSLASGSAVQTQSSGSTSADGGSSNAPSSATATSGPGSTKAAPTNSGSASVTVFTSNSKTITSSIAPTSTSLPSGNVAGNSSTGSGLSLGAKVGIGVGAAVGGLILLAAILALFLLRRKRQKRSPSEVESVGSGSGNGNGTKPAKPDSSKEQRVSAISTTPTVWEADGQAVVEADGRAAWPWTLRSELEGSQVASNRAELKPVAELPGTENFAGEQGAGTTLAQEARRQLGPAWER
ncbi:hypothetical protein N431DRAFT_483415 [Stipitochalara longipes BDJ]|nr:hypothetical protein N431DRAFT_483415 [Stipitochalara longipes BDJ]